MYIGKSQWKIDFSEFSILSSRSCHVIQLWKITPFSTIFSISGGGHPLPPASAPDHIIGDFAGNRTLMIEEKKYVYKVKNLRYG